MSPDSPTARPGWREVVSAIVELSATQAADAEQVLVQLLTFTGPLKLGPSVVPHSQSTADVIRATAIAQLHQISGAKYASVCQAVAAGPVSPIVKRLVAALYPGEPADHPH